ncbi:MAG: 16S rRNA (cytidine(1402)-2'-O)-methyltransferase [Stappiaceae bacterium]
MTSQINTDTTPDSPNRFFIGSHELTAPALESALYIVSTPIGNLGDITVRALQTLAAADMIACEDTRITGVLLNRYGIRVPMLSYHEHNAERQRPKLLNTLNEGKAVALVSDAGTPLISDPGYRLVQDILEAEKKIFPIPGASAVLAALVGAGLATDTFLFAGFLPQKKGARSQRLSDLRTVPATLIFYESARRLKASLADMAQTLGSERQAVVGRELTKRFETFERGTLQGLADRFLEAPKGEIVVVVAPPAEEPVEAGDIDAMLLAALETGSVSSAAGSVAKLSGQNRRELYKRAMELKEKSQNGAPGED